MNSSKSKLGDRIWTVTSSSCVLQCDNSTGYTFSCQFSHGSVTRFQPSSRTKARPSQGCPGRLNETRAFQTQGPDLSQEFTDRFGLREPGDIDESCTMGYLVRRTHILNRYATDEQRSRRSIFIAPPPGSPPAANHTSISGDRTLDSNSGSCIFLLS